jgi:hypothetical protein
LKEKPSWWKESEHGGTYGWSDDHYEQGNAEGIIAIANAIPDMEAMTSLNLASNNFGVEGAKFIAAVLPKCT